MIANPEKFQDIIVKRDRSDTSGVEISLKRVRTLILKKL